jgi:hypothetical protein
VSVPENENTDYWKNVTGIGKLNSLRGTCPATSLSTINPT